MIITKDMSRLGRDYIGTGELIEKYFPNNSIEYIVWFFIESWGN